MGGSGAIWRIYEGQTAPLLSNFLTPLTVSASGSRAYNASTDVSALVNYSGQPNMGLLLGTAVANTSSANAGTYAATPSGLYSNQTGYDITFASGSVTINPVGLTLLSLTANNASKMYGDTYTFTGTEFTPLGLIGSDAISGLTLTSAGAAATANVGNYAIVPSNAVFGTGSASNYNITYVNGTLSVTQRPVTITAQAASMVYGQVDPTLFSVGGQYGLAARDSAATSFSGTFGHTGGNNVGTHTITQGSFTSGNYSITSFTGNTLTITHATLTVSANAQTKFEGSADPALTYRLNGLVQGDIVNGSLSRIKGESIGQYAIRIGNLSAGANYTLVYQGDNLTIIPAPTYSTTDPVVVGSVNVISTAIQMAPMPAIVAPQPAPIVLAVADTTVVADATDTAGDDTATEEKKKAEETMVTGTATATDVPVVSKALPICR